MDIAIETEYPPYQTCASIQSEDSYVHCLDKRINELGLRQIRAKTNLDEYLRAKLRAALEGYEKGEKTILDVLSAQKALLLMQNNTALENARYYL